MPPHYYKGSLGHTIDWLIDWLIVLSFTPYRLYSSNVRVAHHWSTHSIEINNILSKFHTILVNFRNNQIINSTLWFFWYFTIILPRSFQTVRFFWSARFFSAQGFLGLVCLLYDPKSEEFERNVAFFLYIQILVRVIQHFTS